MHFRVVASLLAYKVPAAMRSQNLTHLLFDFFLQMVKLGALAFALGSIVAATNVNARAATGAVGLGVYAPKNPSSSTNWAHDESHPVRAMFRREHHERRDTVGSEGTFSIYHLQSASSLHNSRPFPFLSSLYDDLQPGRLNTRQALLTRTACHRSGRTR